MEIYITEKEGGRRIRLPALPEKIQFKSSGRFAQYEILNIGEIQIPRGQRLSDISWSAMFPGEMRKKEPWIKEWASPNELHKIFNDWRKNGTPLVLLVTETPLNYDVFIEQYDGEFSGPAGDIQYTVSFKERKELIIKVTSDSTKNEGSSSSNRPSQPKPKSYTVKAGDSLWKIAQNYYGKGSQWNKIYTANKSIIEETAKKRGKKSSNNGHLIFPGTVLSIP